MKHAKAKVEECARKAQNEGTRFFGISCDGDCVLFDSLEEACDWTYDDRSRAGYVIEPGAEGTAWEKGEIQQAPIHPKRSSYDYPRIDLD